MAERIKNIQKNPSEYRYRRNQLLTGAKFLFFWSYVSYPLVPIILRNENICRQPIQAENCISKLCFSMLGTQPFLSLRNDQISTNNEILKSKLFEGNLVFQQYNQFVTESFLSTTLLLDQYT